MPPYRPSALELAAQLATANELASLLRDRLLFREREIQELRDQLVAVTERNRQLESMQSAHADSRDE